MLNFPPARRPWDGLGDLASEATATICPPEEDQTRQEDLETTDLNILLRRFGIDPLINAPVQYGEIDFTIDLQDAHSAIQRITEVHATLAPQLLELFPTWQSLVQGADSGALATEIQKLRNSQHESDRQAGIDAALKLDEDKDAARRAKRAALAAQKILKGEDDGPPNIDPATTER